MFIACEGINSALRVLLELMVMRALSRSVQHECWMGELVLQSRGSREFCVFPKLANALKKSV